tara:strand:- start:2643 stop:2906 length:264 start_codon:yes stop_codon:yes gene_type:complete
MNIEVTNATLKNNTIIVECDGEKAEFKVITKPITYTNKDYIYQLKKTQLNLLNNDGIQFLIDAQDINNTFFNSARSLMLSILKNKTT